MKRNSIVLLAAICAALFAGCVKNEEVRNVEKAPQPPGPAVLKANEEQINSMLDAFNEAAAKADLEGYFNFFAADATFLGTDATEHWDKESFRAWAKPYFDKKKTWNFKSLERHVYFDKTGELAWFDELLDTQMKICRGSGVAVKQGGEWKISQYVLSMTIPNDNSDAVTKIKAPIEDGLIEKLKKK